MLILIFGISACNYTQFRWQDYSSSEGRFSIVIPNTPKEEVNSIEVSEGKVLRTNTIKTQINGIAYFVTYVDYPLNVVQASTPENILSRSIIRGVENGIDGELISQEPIQINNAECKKFKAKGKIRDLDSFMKGLFCLEENRLYQVAVFGKLEDKSNSYSDKFINSFKLLNSK